MLPHERNNGEEIRKSINRARHMDVAWAEWEPQCSYSLYQRREMTPLCCGSETQEVDDQFRVTKDVQGAPGRE